MAHNLLDINDDCFLALFKHLSTSELCDIASTCTRFTPLARRIYSFRPQSNRMAIDMKSAIPRRQAPALLRNFGDSLTELKVIFLGAPKTSYNTVVFNLMVEHCGDRLEKLELRSCKYLHADGIVDARPLFSNVKELILYDSNAIDGSSLSDAKELTRLTLTGFHSTNIVKFLANDYPKLRVFSLNQPKNRDDHIDILQFLKRHPNLVELELRDGGAYNLSTIGECCPMLTNVTLWNCENCDIRPISQLSKLVALRLATRLGESLFEVLATSKSAGTLQVLEIVDAE